MYNINLPPPCAPQKTIMEKALAVCAELPFDLKASCTNLTKTYGERQGQ
jgi:hypothetical protein